MTNNLIHNKIKIKQTKIKKFSNKNKKKMNMQKF